MKKTARKKTTSQKTYYEEIIIKPAKRLLKALQGSQASHPQTKTRHSVTSR